MMSQFLDYSLEHADLRIEDDLIFVRVYGHLEEPQIPHLLQIMRQFQQHKPHDRFFLLVDLHATTGLPPAMRRTLAQFMGELQPAAMGMFGANSEQRGAHALLMGAVTGVSGQRPNTAYFHTEAEARVWLLSERQRLLGEVPAAKT